MISKIINMADYLKDTEDRMLESMFASAPIADDGFSGRVIKKVRRHIWVRRLTLPIAASIGVLVSYKPVLGLVQTLAGLTALLPEDLMNLGSSIIPQLPMLVLGGMLLGACMVGLRLLED